VFPKLNWEQRPTGTLQNLYKERAQQIRDRYDHVIVMFSGGMDSWNVVHSFLSNNIHIDEIVTCWPRDERKYRSASSTDRRQSNVNSEYEYAVLPVIEHIQKHFPKVNIVLDDFSERLHGEVTEDSFKTMYSYQNMPGLVKFNNKTELEKIALSQNKKIALVTGSEKTHVTSINGDFYAFFTDQSNMSDDYGRNVEFFYWSPEFPYIPVMQAHYLMEELKRLVAETPDLKITKGDMFRKVYQAACYPEYNIETFQARKEFGSMLWTSDSWIHKYNPNYYYSWKWVVDQYFPQIDASLTEKVRGTEITAGLKLIDSPLYLVAKNTGIPDFKV
jgi:hypothetical protein